MLPLRLRALLGAPLDYLILDWALPDAGGGIILRRVRDAGMKTRVAVTTGTDDSDQLREIGDLRPEAVFEKPVNVADVWWEAVEGPRGVSLSATIQPRTRPGPPDDRSISHGGRRPRKPPYSFLIYDFR